jgi:hypothetical protein
LQCLFEAEASVFAGVVVVAVDGVAAVVYVENVGDVANCQQDCYVAFFEWEFEATASVVNGEWVNFRKYRYLFLHLQNEILNMFSSTYMKNALIKELLEIVIRCMNFLKYMLLS